MSDFLDLIIALVAVSSVTLVWVRGEIFDPFKRFLIDDAGKYDKFVATLVYCSMCSGFWVGVFSYLFIQPDMLNRPIWIEWPLWSCMVSVSSIAIDRLIWKKPYRPVFSDIPPDETIRG